MCYLRAGAAGCFVFSGFCADLRPSRDGLGLGVRDVCPLLFTGLLALPLTPFMNSGTPPDTSNPTGKFSIHSLASGQVGPWSDVAGSNCRSASPKGRLDDDCDDEMLSAIEGLSSTR